MPVSTKGELKIWQRRDRAKQLKIWASWLIGVAIFMFCWKIISDATTWFFVFDAPRIAADIGGRAWPPRWSYLSELWKPMWDTINIATLGTLLAIIIGVPVAFLAATNTTPSRKFLTPIGFANHRLNQID